MAHNWEKIFRNKSVEELYRIYLGKSHLNDEAIGFAKKELKNRNIDFENIEKHKKKWELERLIRESEENRFFFGSITSSRHFLLMAITGAIIAVITIFDVFLEYSFQTNKEEYRLDEILLFFFSLIFMTYGFFMHKKEKKREQIRNKRISEIIEDL